MFRSADIENHLRPESPAPLDEVRGGDTEGGEVQVVEEVRRLLTTPHRHLRPDPAQPRLLPGHLHQVQSLKDLLDPLTQMSDLKSRTIWSYPRYIYFIPQKFSSRVRLNR